MNGKKKGENIDSKHTLWEAVQEAINRATTRYTTRSKEFGAGGVLKAQSGVLLPQNPEFVAFPMEVGHLTDATSSYSVEDLKNGVGITAADGAEIASLLGDLGGLVLSEVPAGEILGVSSDIAAFIADVSRDGLQ